MTSSGQVSVQVKLSEAKKLKSKKGKDRAKEFGKFRQFQKRIAKTPGGFDDPELVLSQEKPPQEKPVTPAIKAGQEIEVKCTDGQWHRAVLTVFDEASGDVDMHFSESRNND